MTAEVPFLLNAAQRPNPEQKAILEAISCSARSLLPDPGAIIKAVPVQSVAEGGQPSPFEFAGGFLPLELAAVPAKLGVP